MDKDTFKTALGEVYLTATDDTCSDNYWDPNLYSTGGITFQPHTGNTGSVSNYNYPLTFSMSATESKYSVMNLPRKEMPIAIFVSGKMVTLGLLGTDVECAYTMKQIVFSPGVIKGRYFNNRITVSVEYNDEILHYNIGNEENSDIYESATSSTIKLTLVSTIKKEGVILGAK